MSGGALSGKVKKPDKPPNIRCGFNVKGRIPLKHALQFTPDGAGSAQGNQVAGKNETAVTVGGARSNGVLFQEADLFALLCQIISTGQPDDAAPDYQNIAVSFHLLTDFLAERIEKVSCEGVAFDSSGAGDCEVIRIASDP
jgi:hypothetical protein